MTALITSLAQGKQVLDNYILDDRPLNLDEMRALQDNLTNGINEMQAVLRLLTPQQKAHPMALKLLKRLGMRGF